MKKTVLGVVWRRSVGTAMLWGAGRNGGRLAGRRSLFGIFPTPVFFYVAVTTVLVAASSNGESGT